MSATIFGVGQVSFKDGTNRKVMLDIMQEDTMWVAVPVNYFLASRLELCQVVFFSASFAINEKKDFISDALTMVEVSGKPSDPTYGLNLPDPSCPLIAITGCVSSSTLGSFDLNVTQYVSGSRHTFEFKVLLTSKKFATWAAVAQGSNISVVDTFQTLDESFGWMHWRSAH